MNLTALVTGKEMEFHPETIFVDKSVADHPLTLKTLLQFPNTPVEYNITLDEAVQMIQKTSTDVFGAGKRNLILTRFKGSFLKKALGLAQEWFAVIIT